MVSYQLSVVRKKAAISGMEIAAFAFARNS
jgi:hypothetical protein